MPTKHRGIQHKCVLCQNTRFDVYYKEGKYHLYCIWCGNFMASAEPRDRPPPMVPVEHDPPRSGHLPLRGLYRCILCPRARWPHCGVVSPHGCTPESDLDPREES